MSETLIVMETHFEPVLQNNRYQIPYYLLIMEDINLSWQEQKYFDQFLYTTEKFEALKTGALCIESMANHSRVYIYIYR